MAMMAMPGPGPEPGAGTTQITYMNVRNSVTDDVTAAAQGLHWQEAAVKSQIQESVPGSHIWDKSIQVNRLHLAFSCWQILFIRTLSCFSHVILFQRKFP